jgi:hypothetical protein
MGQGIGRLAILLLALLEHAGRTVGSAGVAYDQGVVTVRMGCTQSRLIPACQGQPASLLLQSTRQGAAKSAGGTGDQDVAVIGHKSGFLMLRFGGQQNLKFGEKIMATRAVVCL